MLGQFLFHAVRIGARFIHLVDGNDDWNACCLRVADGLDGLRHHAVVCRDNQYRDIGDMRATHCGECLVSRCIEEYDLLSVDHNLGRADMLRDAAGLGGGDVGLTNRVEQGGLTMVNVSHDGDDRCSRLEIFLFILKELQTFFFLFFFDLGNDDADAQIVRQNHNGILVDTLVDIGHDTHLHQRHDDLGCGYPDLFTEAGNGDRRGNRDSSGWKIFQNILFFLYDRLRSVVLLRFCQLLQGTLLDSLFILLALAAAVIQLGEFVSFFIRMNAFFDILLRRFRFHLGK